MNTQTAGSDFGLQKVAVFGYACSDFTLVFSEPSWVSTNVLSIDLTVSGAYTFGLPQIVISQPEHCYTIVWSVGNNDFNLQDDHPGIFNLSNDTEMIVNIDGDNIA